MSPPNPQATSSTSQQATQASQIPTQQFRAISRNDSNASTASSSNKGDVSSTISTANSVTSSSRSQLSKQHQQYMDHRQLLATCAASSTPIRSFQRATISSVVKTRAFDNNPVLQGLLATPSPSGHNSTSNSQTTSPHSTPLFSRSRSLRMSGGPSRYQKSPIHYRTSSRTPELYSFNSGDNFNDTSHVKLTELNNEKLELRENLEFLECERQVLIDTSKELKDTLHNERSHWKREQEELKRQLTDQMRARVKAESQLTKNEVDMNETRKSLGKLNEELEMKNKFINELTKKYESLQSDNKELIAINEELKNMLTEKLKFNGLGSQSASLSDTNQQVSDCKSIVTEMARLRLELNEKDRIIGNFKHDSLRVNDNISSTKPTDIDNLNYFLNETVENIKNWPQEIASSKHVQDLMKSLLKIGTDQDLLATKLEGIHL